MRGNALPGFGVILGALIALSPGAFADDTRPNVILVYTDDQGTADAPGFGADDLTLPHLEALADSGVRFTQFYAPAPVCSPSRAGMLTGRYPLRAGVPGNVSSMSAESGLPLSETTMAEVFREAGYATAHIGKWHLGHGETGPNAQGFDESFGHMVGCIDNYSHFFYWEGPNRHDLYRNGVEVFESGKFFPDLMVREATAFVEAHAEDPFFIYFALNLPHYPYQGDEKWLRHYQEQRLPYPRDLYAAFLSTLDERLGQLLAVLEAQGLRENTIVVFQSDNGHSMEERAHFGGGSAGPYRGAKFSLFEGGIRVPAVISWPGNLPSGEVRTQAAHGCDWLPTLAELCGIEPPGGLDGRSLLPVLRDADAPSPHDTLHWDSRTEWAVRQGPWKLMHRTWDPTLERPKRRNVDEWFLVNLDNDPAEQTNLAASEPEQLKRMRALHDAWRDTL